LVLFKELKIDVQYITRGKSVHHLEKKIDVSRPFSDDSGYRFGAERFSFSVVPPLRVRPFDGDP
jgi:hypothetical protein